MKVTRDNNLFDRISLHATNGERFVLLHVFRNDGEETFDYLLAAQVLSPKLLTDAKGNSLPEIIKDLEEKEDTHITTTLDEIAEQIAKRDHITFNSAKTLIQEEHGIREEG